MKEISITLTAEDVGRLKYALKKLESEITSTVAELVNFAKHADAQNIADKEFSSDDIRMQARIIRDILFGGMN